MQLGPDASRRFLPAVWDTPDTPPWPTLVSAGLARPVRSVAPTHAAVPAKPCSSMLHSHAVAFLVHAPQPTVRQELHCTVEPSDVDCVGIIDNLIALRVNGVAEGLRGDDLALLTIFRPAMCKTLPYSIADH